MFSQPADLPEHAITAALADGWGFGPASLEYLPVGFGSHHWRAVSPAGDRLFVTVDDLVAKQRDEADSTGAVFGRLTQTFGAALSLRRDCGLDFVVAPIPAATSTAAGGAVLRRLSDRYSLLVHAYLDAPAAGTDGDFADAADRRAVVGLLARLHQARPPVRPVTDDLAVPQAAALRAAVTETDRPWRAGPYSERARVLLATHARSLTRLLGSYDQLAALVAARSDRFVVTHGEPHAANTLRTAAGLVFVDWDSALLAPPERDLWALAESDPDVLTAYQAASGTAVDAEALTACRLWYDLFEIAGYIRWLRGPHEDTADTAEAWHNLELFLRPAERWPALSR